MIIPIGNGGATSGVDLSTTWSLRRKGTATEGIGQGWARGLGR